MKSLQIPAGCPAERQGSVTRQTSPKPKVGRAVQSTAADEYVQRLLPAIAGDQSGRCDHDRGRNAGPQRAPGLQWHVSTVMALKLTTRCPG
jgi:hypothetical protein